jgi:hypothetical protein
LHQTAGAAFLAKTWGKFFARILVRRIGKFFSHLPNLFFNAFFHFCYFFHYLTFTGKKDGRYGGIV